MQVVIFAALFAVALASDAYPKPAYPAYPKAYDYVSFSYFKPSLH